MRIDVVQTASLNQALHDVDVFSSRPGSIEQPVFLFHRDDAQGARQMTGIDRVRPGDQEENFEASTPFTLRCERTGEEAAG
ncbi:hypothetical protein [Actimicrobium sp. CCI2.3]|uniref:hypothetical protein n=1 Tax=Actimicrobium sp. CCI2.3 TaxID=3048616 RepID=UPI002AB3B5D0|nr:hypothetical protein [Actimicrobium sp. CCI2.3]MDY7573711.1 hypothetical protein [Actimicrobium sp. CCI2.3]MEB0021017.1 hypothetical protein [Actimicrobium sp. CCI2.3]